MLFHAFFILVSGVKVVSKWCQILAMSKDQFVVKFGLGIVVCYLRSDGRYSLRWREDSATKRTTRASKEGARSEARKIAKRLDGGGNLTVSKEQYDFVRSVESAMGGRSIASISELISRLLKATQTTAEIESVVEGVELRSSAVRTSVVQAWEYFQRDFWACGTRSKESIKSINHELNSFLSAHKDCYLNDLDEILPGWMERGKPSAQYFNNRRAAWLNFLNRAIERGELPKDAPTAAAKIKKRNVPQVSPEIFTVGECEESLLFLREQRPLLVPAFAIAVFAGLRPSEIRRLKWGNIDIDSGYIELTAKTARKLEQARFVPIQENLKAILLEYKKPAKESIVTLTGWRNISVLLRESETIERWKEDVTRHSYISYRLAQTSSLSRVADEAGNSEAIIKKKYRRPLRAKNVT